MGDIDDYNTFLQSIQVDIHLGLHVLVEALQYHQDYGGVIH